MIPSHRLRADSNSYLYVLDRYLLEIHLLVTQSDRPKPCCSEGCNTGPAVIKARTIDQYCQAEGTVTDLCAADAPWQSFWGKAKCARGRQHDVGFSEVICQTTCTLTCQTRLDGSDSTLSRSVLETCRVHMVADLVAR